MPQAMSPSRRFRDKTQDTFAPPQRGAAPPNADTFAVGGDRSDDDPEDDDPEDDTAGYGAGDDDENDDPAVGGADDDDADGDPDDENADDDDDAPAPAIRGNAAFAAGGRSNRPGVTGRDNAAFAPRGNGGTMSKAYNTSGDSDDEGAIAVVQGEEFVKGITGLIRREIKTGIAAVLAGGENDLAETVRAEVQKAVAPVHTLVKSLMDDNDAFQDHIDDRFDRTEVASAELSKSVSNLLAGANLVKGVTPDAQVPAAPVNPAYLTPAPRGAATAPVAKGVLPGSAVPGGAPDLRAEVNTLMAKAEGIQERLHKAVPGMTDITLAIAHGSQITDHMVAELRAGVAGAE